MKTLFKKFLTENHLEAKKLLAGQAGRKASLGALTKYFSLWLSGYKDEKKTQKRFLSTYRINKFFVRKQLLKLSA